MGTASVSPGVIIVIPQDAPVRDVAETLLLIWADAKPEDSANRVEIIPW